MIVKIDGAIDVRSLLVGLAVRDSVQQVTCCAESRTSKPLVALLLDCIKLFARFENMLPKRNCAASGMRQVFENSESLQTFFFFQTVFMESF